MSKPPPFLPWLFFIDYSVFDSHSPTHCLVTLLQIPGKYTNFHFIVTHQLIVWLHYCKYQELQGNTPTFILIKHSPNLKVVNHKTNKETDVINFRTID